MIESIDNQNDSNSNILYGGPVKSLMNNVHDFNDNDDINFYKKLVSNYNSTGISTGQLTVRYGPTSKAKATIYKSTWLMRNGQLRYRVSALRNGSYKVEVRAWDIFNVTPQSDKGGVYNIIGSILDPLHKASGGNPNMQVRAQWQVIVK